MKHLLLLSVVVTLVLTTVAVEKSQTTEDGSRYFIETEQKFTWSEALAECNRMQMSLVAIDSLNKHLQISNMMKAKYDATERRFWSGGHDNVVDKHFEWISTGLGFSYTNWNTGEPNTYTEDEHCVMIYSKKFSWNDEPCSKKLGFICEPMLEEETSELDVLKKSLETRTNHLAKKTEELSALKQSSAMLKQEYEQLDTSMKTKEIQVNQTLKENIEQMDALKISNEKRTDQLKLKQQELDSLQKYSEEKENQLKQKQQELDASMKIKEIQMNQTLKKNTEELDALKKSHDIQTDQLKLKQQELDSLQKSSEEELNQLKHKKEELETSLKTQEIQVNQTLKKNIEELEALKKSHDIQTDQLKLQQEELDSLQKSSEEKENQLKQKQQELDASLKTKEIQVNQTLKESLAELDALKKSYADQLKQKQDCRTFNLYNVHIN